MVGDWYLHIGLVLSLIFLVDEVVDEGDDDDANDADDDEVADGGGECVAPGGAWWVGGGDGDGSGDGVVVDAGDGVVYQLRAVTKLILGGGDVDGVACLALCDVDGVTEVDGVVTDGQEMDGVTAVLLGGDGDVVGAGAAGEKEEE